MNFLEKLIIGSVIFIIAFGGVVFGNVLASSNKVDINTKFCIPSKNTPSFQYYIRISRNTNHFICIMHHETKIISFLE